MDRDLKYRRRLSTTTDVGLYKAFYNYSIASQIPMSKLMDEALVDFLTKHDILYERAPSFKRKIK